MHKLDISCAFMVEHLQQRTIVELGSFYTPKRIVDLVYHLIAKNKITFDFVCDTSAGYGDFIRPDNKDKFIYLDLDYQALDSSRQRHGKIFKYLCGNALQNLTRGDLGLQPHNKLLIVGNPPYNDRTSFYKKHEKGEFLISEELQNRDLGIAFLKSFVRLNPDYICVLHPLSYLVKASKFRSLKQFKDNYRLIDGIVISSKHFSNTSKKTHFPILIGVYKRDYQGMTFDFIQNFPFSIDETNYTFKINQFLYIEDLHTKYKQKDVAQPYEHFYTLRDMNQLTINRDWLLKETTNSIRVKTENKHLFRFLTKLRRWFSHHQNQYYFLGNLSPIIFLDWVDNKELLKLSDQDFTDRFEQKLTNKGVPPWKIDLDPEQLIWQFSNVSAGSKYRFKLREKWTDYGETVSSASHPVTKNCFLEAQVAYDKTLKDFEQKLSLHKITFNNHKGEKRFFFELSDMLYWAVKNHWINKQGLKNKQIKAQKTQEFVDQKFPIKIDDPNDEFLFGEFDFIRSDVAKPRLISRCGEDNFVEIKIDKRQRAPGDQGMVYYNINATNLTKNGQSIIGQTIKKADVLEYVIRKDVFPDIFIKLVVVFLHLSANHHQDMQAIISKILSLKS